MSILEHRHCWICKKVLTLTESNHKWQKTSSSVFPEKLRSRAYDHSEDETDFPRRERSGYGKMWGLCDDCGKTYNLKKEPDCTFTFDAGPLQGMGGMGSIPPSKEILDSFWNATTRHFKCVLKEGHKGVHATEINGNSVNWESDMIVD